MTIKEKHNWTEWIYCEDFHTFNYSRVCKSCGCIDFTDNPCME